VKDISRFAGPTLRGWPRAPYFHNGSADSLERVVNSTTPASASASTPAEKRDLVAFLQTL
jgi:cytochrome c peroxidase